MVGVGVVFWGWWEWWLAVTWVNMGEMGTVCSVGICLCNVKMLVDGMLNVFNVLEKGGLSP